MLNKNNFYIEILIRDEDGNHSPLRLTSFENGASNNLGTFNENVKFSGDTKELTFSLFSSYEGKTNPYLPYLVNDRKIRLIDEFLEEDYLEFYITNIQPTITNDNILYTYTCQDAFSYDLSRQSVSMFFSTDDDSIWGTNTGPKPIDQIVQKVLELSSINYINGVIDTTNWRVSEEFLNVFYVNSYRMDETMRISLETTSTPFNIIVEALQLFNANLIINYKNKTINFDFKERSLKGLVLKPEYNLSKFSYADDGTQLCNIMHIQGAEDAYGNYVSIVPAMPKEVQNYLLGDSGWQAKTTSEILTETWNSESREFWDIIGNKIPHAGSFLYDFSYWVKSGLISSQTEETIKESFDKDLRNINLQILCYSSLYYETLAQINKVESQEKNIIAAIAALRNEQADLTEDVMLHGFQDSLLYAKDGQEYIKIFSYQGVEPYVTASNLQYGLLDGVDYSYCLPSFYDLVENTSVLLFKDGEEDQSYNYSITSLDNTNNTFQVNLSSETNFAIYCPLTNDFKLNTNVTLIGLNNHTQDSYFKDLTNICNDSYLSFAINMYGKEYFNKRVAEMQSNLDSERKQLQQVERELLDLSETNTIAEALNVSITGWEIAKQVDYGQLVASRQELILLTGGIGKSGNHFSGYYEAYINHLNSLTKRSASLTEPKNTIEDQYTEFLQERDTWWSNFYVTYQGIVRETRYDDSTQITSDGLYAAAMKQFILNKDSQKTYNISYLTTDDLLPISTRITIGDRITVFAPQPLYQSATSKAIVQIRKQNSIPLQNHSSLYFKMGENDVYGQIFSLKSDGIYYIAEVSFKQEYSVLDILKMKLQNGIMDSISPVLKEEKIYLRINEINHNLRENTSTLVVENNTLINQIVDKLLASIN